MQSRLHNGFTLLALSLSLWMAGGCAHVTPPQNGSHAFRFDRDTFAFENQLVWNYKDGVRAQAPEPEPTKEQRYTHHCFVMARATIQFFRFARFDPQAPAIAHEELVRRIRAVAAYDPTAPDLPPEKRIVFPGYANLHDLSRREAAAMKANIGATLPTYLRLGNFFLPFEMSKEHQLKTNEEIQMWLRLGQPMALWIYDFDFPHPRMNHSIVIYAQASAGKTVAYSTYDPNEPDAPKNLEFDPQTGRFSYQKTNCFPGGKVTIRPCYVSWLE